MLLGKEFSSNVKIHLGLDHVDMNIHICMQMFSCTPLIKILKMKERSEAVLENIRRICFASYDSEHNCQNLKSFFSVPMKG